tara:strand:+ start:323 stop:916 length:594 start_codon:yes stop_codon:yes gene_type:complete
MRVFMSKMILQLMALLGLSEMVFSEESDQFPPVPSWQPAFSAPVELQLERMVFYTDDTRDLVQYKNGTVVVINKGLDDNEAKLFANEVLSKIYNYHPDMNPLNMKDGNILVRYNHPAFNVVLTEFTSKYIDTIRNKYRDALATHEVIITGLGTNVFDDFGKQALDGRTFMFMDAQNPEVVAIYRSGKSNNLKQNGTR